MRIYEVVFSGMLLATLTMIGLCNLIGVGHFWPFPVIISMLITDVALGVTVARKAEANQ